MSLIRLYVTHDLDQNQSLELSLPQTHYLLHVMRVGVGTNIAVFNGKQGLWKATITHITHKSTSITLNTLLSAQTTTPDIWLCCAPIKPTPFQYLLQKATELGISNIQPVQTKHTVVHHLSYERLSSILIEAAEQSRRLTLPVLHPVTALPSLLAGWNSGRILLVCDESGHGSPLYDTLLTLPKTTPLAILTGPEGGFSDSEFELLRKQPYTRPVSLGPRILRADTAGITAIACCMSVMGDWHHLPDYKDIS